MIRVKDSEWERETEKERYLGGGPRGGVNKTKKTMVAVHRDIECKNLVNH